MSRLGVALRLLAWILLLAVIVGPHWLSLRVGPGRLAAWAPVLFHRVFLRLFGVRVTVAGTPPGRHESALVIANHVSWLDIPVLGSLRPLSFVAKSEIAGWPVIGTMARLQRTVFIDRSKRSHTAVVNGELADRIGRGDLVVLFAEGTTGDGNRLLPFRTSLVGAARGALDAGVPVLLQPLAIAYVRRHGMPLTRAERPDVAWIGDTELVPHAKLFVARGPLDVHVVWGKPIAFSAGTDRKRVTALAKASIRRALQEAVTGRPSQPALPPRLGDTSETARASSRRAPSAFSVPDRADPEPVTRRETAP